MKFPLFLVPILMVSGVCAQGPGPIRDSEGYGPGTTGHVFYEDASARDSVWLEATADSTLNFRVFGRYARDDAYYGKLAERFAAADTTLIGSDFFVLYYGYAYRDRYDGGYGVSPWNSLISEGNYREAYDMVISELETRPATPYLLAPALNLSEVLERPEAERQNLQWRLRSVLSWIEALGDGSEENPYPVVNGGDQQTMMYYHLGVERVLHHQFRESRYGTLCEVMEVQLSDDSLYRDSEIWFDVTFPHVMPRSPNHWANRLIHD